MMFCRLFLAGLALLAVSLALFETSSLNHQMLLLGGPWAEAAAFVLAALAVMTIIDVVINDIAPDEWHFAWVLAHRHLLWGLMAAAFASFGFLMARLDIGDVVAIQCMFYSIGCVAVAFLDLTDRARAVAALGGTD